MSIGEKAGKGFFSYLFRNMLEKLMGVIAMVFLARKLSPYDFGLVSITEILLSLISVLGTTGLAEFLLAYRKDDTDDIFRAAFWFNVCITAGVVILFFILVPFWSVWQHDDKIRNISWVVGGIFIFSQLQILPKAWLSKNLLFDKQVKIQAPFIVLISLTKIVAIFWGLGVYSLIIPTLIFQPLLTLLLYRATTIRPHLNLYIERWKEIFHFTKHLIGAVIFSRITDHGDKLILARFIGLDKLGIYNIAFQLAELITSQPVQVSNNLLSSVLPKYTDNKVTFYKNYMAFLKTFSFFIFPLLAIMFVAAKPVVLLLYGQKWLDVVLPLQILLIAAAFKAVSSSYGSVMNSFHLNNKSFIVTAVYMPFHLLASISGAAYGVVGIVSGVTAVKIIFINWNIKQLMNVLSQPFFRWYKDTAPYFLVNGIISAIIIILFSLYYLSIPPIVYILLTVFLFLAAYIIVFRIGYKRQINEISRFIHTVSPTLSPYFNFLFKV